MLKLDEIIGNKMLLNVIYIVLIGLCVILFGMSFLPTTSNESESQDVVSALSGGATLEERLKHILSKINGVGEVDVLLTFESGEEIVIANESQVSKSTSADGSSAQSESIESKPVLRNNGTGQTPIVLKETFPRVRGVIVSISEPATPSIRETITTAVVAALGIRPSAVSVIY